MGRAINLVTEIPGPRSAEVLARKSRVVCDPIDVHLPAVIDQREVVLRRIEERRIRTIPHVRGHQCRHERGTERIRRLRAKEMGGHAPE